MVMVMYTNLSKTYGKSLVNVSVQIDLLVFLRDKFLHGLCTKIYFYRNFLILGNWIENSLRSIKKAVDF